MCFLRYLLQSTERYGPYKMEQQWLLEARLIEPRLNFQRIWTVYSIVSQKLWHHLNLCHLIALVASLEASWWNTEHFNCYFKIWKVEPGNYLPDKKKKPGNHSSSSITSSEFREHHRDREGMRISTLSCILLNLQRETGMSFWLSWLHCCKLVHRANSWHLKDRALECAVAGIIWYFMSGLFGLFVMQMYIYRLLWWAINDRFTDNGRIIWINSTNMVNCV